MRSRCPKRYFCNSLNEQIKVQLAFCDEPSSFEELASLAIRVDNRIPERKRVRDSNSHKPLREHSTRESYPPRLPQDSRPVDNLSATNTEVTESMQLGRTHLTPEERSRRMSNKECIYCGSPSHFIASCSVGPNKHAHQ